MKCLVYCLFKSRKSRPFYFGITWCRAVREASHRRKYGQAIHFCVLTECPCAASAGACERQYIRLFETLGWPLLNVAGTRADALRWRERTGTPERRQASRKAMKDWWASKRKLA